MRRDPKAYLEYMHLIMGIKNYEDRPRRKYKTRSVVNGSRVYDTAGRLSGPEQFYTLPMGLGTWKSIAGVQFCIRPWGLGPVPQWKHTASEWSGVPLWNLELSGFVPK